MLVYRPSRGNDSVTLTYTGEWTGQSIGREVIIKDKFGPTDYFHWYPSDLSADSTWLYKPVTNVDFTAGFTYYRAIYIGPNERENLQEFIGTIDASAVACVDNLPTTDINVSIWSEGVFTTLGSKNSIVLDDETDSTYILDSAGANFVQSINVNQSIPVGSWLKVWIKIEIPTDDLLVDADVCYVVSIGSLSIKISKDIARLSLSRVFHGDLRVQGGDIITKELIPTIDEMGKIYKVINLEPNQTHVFYSNVDGEFHDLIVERHNNAYDNKFIDVNVSPVTGPITGADIVSASALKAVQDVFACVVSGDENLKFIVDIVASQLPDRSYFYVFYNQLTKYDDGQTVSTSAETIPKYEANYGHDKYRWTCGVVSLDFNMFGIETFKETAAGYDNKVEANNWTGQDHKIKDDFFITSISMQDDLFTALGYNTENSYQTVAPEDPVFVVAGKNYFTEMALIWEKDILLNQVKPQIIKTPSIAAINTIEERSNNKAQLVVDNWAGIDNFDLSHEKATYSLVDISGHYLRYCDLGSPHGNKLKHYEDASISFDTEEELSEWSATFAFRLPVAASSITAASFGPYDASNATQMHIIDISGYNNIINGTNVSDPLLTIPSSIVGDISLFSVNVKNSDYKAIEVIYNAQTGTIGVVTIDTSGNETMQVVSSKIYLGQENVVTINTYKMQVADLESCAGKVLVNYQIYLNGEELSHGSTFVFDSLDPLVLIYNPDKQFGGSISYFELRDYLDNASEYAKAMFKIHSNIAWAHPLYDTDNNVTTIKELQVFQNKRTINFNNLPITKQEIVIPIVLLGNGFALANHQNYNSNALRTYDSFVQNQITFDFKKVNLNNLDIAFTMLGDGNLLEWTADEYNVKNDTLVIWVKIPSYIGQKIVMYYNAQRISSTQPIERKNAFKNFHGAWTMNKFATTYGYRFVDQQLFNAGENILFLQHDDDKYLVQIDYQYMYGYKNVYKSNKFDIAFDDRNIGPEQMPIFENFMTEFVGQFKPDFMTINKVRSKFNYRLEIDNYTPKD